MRPGHAALALSALLCGAAWSATPTVAGGNSTQRMGAAIFATVTHSDNEGRVNGNAGTSLDAGLNLDIQRLQGNLQADVGGTLLYRRYQNVTGGNPLEGTLNGHLGYVFSPQRFTWVLDDNFGQALVSQQRIDGASNRQNFNFLSTGPDLSLPLSQRLDLVASGRWADARYRESEDLNNQRYSATLGLSRQMGSLSTLSFRGSVQKVSYAAAGAGTDFRTHSESLNWNARGSKTTLTMQAGVSHVDQQGLGQGEPLYNVSIDRTLTARSQLRFAAGQGISDNAESFRRDQIFVAGLIDQAPDAVAAGAFRSRHASAGWALRGLRNSVDVAVTWSEDDYFDSAQSDRSRLGQQLQFRRLLSPTISLGLNAARWEDSYGQGGTNNQETSAGASLSWQVMTAMSLSFSAQRMSGEGLALVGPGTASYSENRFSLQLNYQLGQ